VRAPDAGSALAEPAFFLLQTFLLQSLVLFFHPRGHHVFS